jgi:putative oxidoreductase
MNSETINAVLRLLLGILAVYGGVLHFTQDVAVWKSPFLNSLYQTGYLWQLIGIINLVAGLLLLINSFVPAALLLLLPITVNILLFHIFFFTPEGLYIGIPMFALNAWCAWQYRTQYKPLLQFKTYK